MATYAIQMDTVQYITGEMNAVTSKVNEIVTQIDQLKMANWESSAREFFNVHHAKWVAAANDMREMAQNAVNSLGHINDSYYAGERQGVSLWDY